MAGNKKVIQPGPVKGMPVTQPSSKKKRPSLGSGGAEQAAQDLQSLGLRRKRAIAQATGRKRNKQGN